MVIHLSTNTNSTTVYYFDFEIKSSIETPMNEVEGYKEIHCKASICYSSFDVKIELENPKKFIRCNFEVIISMIEHFINLNFT